MRVRMLEVWRIWTRGWGPRDWVSYMWREGAPMWVAWHLPHRVAMWTFIRVYAESGDGPGPEYKQALDAWERRRAESEEDR